MERTSCKSSAVLHHAVKTNHVSRCSGQGYDVTLVSAATQADEHSEDHAGSSQEDAMASEGADAEASTTQEGASCHFHAGVEYVYLCLAFAIVRQLT